jgi:ribonuclease-3
MEEKRLKALDELINKLHIDNIDMDLLDLALTHPSFAVEHGHGEDNQRLEFLGDAVVDLLMGQYLYEQYPADDEGKLTKMRATLVCEAALAEAATNLGLDHYLLLGHGELLSGGLKRASNLADAWEAMCGAIYLCVGTEPLKPVLTHYLSGVIDRVKQGYYGDFKTRLQEYVQRQQGHSIAYTLLEEEGPAHDRRFHMAVEIDGVERGSGWGKTKKEAQSQAALEALIFFGELSPLTDGKSCENSVVKEDHACS